MKVTFSDHARAALQARGIDETWVERTLARPDAVEPDPVHPERRRVYGSVPEREGRVLRVVCLDGQDEIRIITAFLDRGRRALP